MTALAEIEKGIILSLMNFKGYGEMFPRVVSAMKRVHKEMPEATGKEKKAKLLAEWHIIFDDIIVPIGTDVINFLIDLIHIRSYNAA